MEEAIEGSFPNRRTSDIPNGERDVLVLDGLDVETCVGGSQRGRRRGMEERRREPKKPRREEGLEGRSRFGGVVERSG